MLRHTLTAATGAVAALTLALLVAPPASADDETCPPGPTDDEGWTYATCVDPTGADTGHYQVSRSWTISMGQTINAITKACYDYDSDPDGDFLRALNLSQGYAVPYGTKVDEPGGVGVTSLILTGPGGYANGIDGLSMTNWVAGGDPTVTITLYCSKIQSEWYKP